jgi:UPF0271 protein
MKIDLNADVGEGMDDAPVLAAVTSVNVACGLHAGDAITIERTVARAVELGLGIGAHPGYADKEHFGRNAVEMPLADLEALILYQVGAVAGFVRSHGGELKHVKPHGALYHRASESAEVARAVASAVRRFDAGLFLVGPPDSRLIEAGREAGLRVAVEAFADRGYRSDGRLVPRGQAGALHADADQAAAQALSIARDGTVVATDGSVVHLRADTLCLHGDTPDAGKIAARVRERLVAAGVALAPLT